jgi:serine/threonine-protein kinase
MFGDKWRLERLLGVGGVGAVYEARHRNGSRAAIKVLHRDLAWSALERERFLREAWVANRVEHPAVVRVLDDGVSDGEPFLLMELVDGEPLDAVAERLGQAEALDVAEQVLDALVVAHARGVIHRDIKPQNLLLDRQRRVRILDFGLAHLTEEGATEEEGTITGTLDYMAPEQVAGQIASPQSDLYSLGAMLFRLVSGEHLHNGANLLDQLRRIVCEPPRPLRSAIERGDDLDEDVVALVDRATLPSAVERWQSAEQMRREVRRIRKSLPPCTWDLGRSARSEEPTMRLRTPALPMAALTSPPPVQPTATIAAPEPHASKKLYAFLATLALLILLVLVRA